MTRLAPGPDHGEARPIASLTRRVCACLCRSTGGLPTRCLGSRRSRTRCARHRIATRAYNDELALGSLSCRARAPRALLGNANVVAHISLTTARLPPRPLRWPSPPSSAFSSRSPSSVRHPPRVPAGVCPTHPVSRTGGEITKLQPDTIRSLIAHPASRRCRPCHRLHRPQVNACDAAPATAGSSTTSLLAASRPPFLYIASHFRLRSSLGR